MSVKRTAALLAAWISLALMARGVMAQPATANLNYQAPQPSYSNASAPFSNDMPTKGHNLNPFGPMDVEPDLDMFGPANTSGYGNGPRPKIGWYGSYERVFWSLSKPDTSLVGIEFKDVLQSLDIGTTLRGTVDNSFIGAIGAWGNRWEVGFIDADAYGWQVSVLDHVSQGQFRVVNNAPILFTDPNFFFDALVRVPTAPTFQIFNAGSYPTVFDTVEMKNLTTLNGVEIMRQYRAPRKHNGGVFELMYGPRWFQLDDAFIVRASGSVPDIINITGSFAADPGPPAAAAGTATAAFSNPLANSTWATRAQNNLIGPQIGGRWYHQREHWITTFEGRFLAAVNFQNIHQVVNLGDQNNPVASPGRTTFHGLGANTHQYITTFAPLGEIRLNATYQATANVGLTVGYTGMVVGNISRGSNRVDYTSADLISINAGHNDEIFFLNGLNFGFEINR